MNIIRLLLVGILLACTLMGCGGQKKVPSEISWMPEDSLFIDESHMLRISANFLKGTSYRDGPYIIVSIPQHLKAGFESFNNTSSETVDLSSGEISELVDKAGLNKDNAIKVDSLYAQKMLCDSATNRCVSRLQFSNQVRSEQFMPGTENGLWVYFVVFDEEYTATQAVEIMPEKMGKK